MTDATREGRRESFDVRVLARSHEIPVVVDFWAPWCAPCRVLGPVLEELAAAADGKWELVKVNTEEEPEPAARHHVQSIPAVKMFHRGEVLSEFVGALPREQVRAWLDDSLPDPRRERLRELVGEWDRRGAAIAPEIESLLGEDFSGEPHVRLRLAQVLAPTDLERAREIFRATEAPIDLADLAADVESLIDLMTPDGGGSERLEGLLESARRALSAHDVDTALEHLVDAAMIDKRYREELARRATVAIFRLLGSHHPLTEKHERRLSMAILS